ncbi:TetR/AcrR family transcriptional regulator [Parvicella tangerina]|nr:TetR/AcrR family transcriptional regulator [Parvicella tangerina]
MENEYKLELTQKIAEVFMRLGIRSVNMDDLARNLSVSKKTLYKYFKDKSDVVKQVTQTIFNTEEELIAGVVETSENAIDENIRIFEIANRMLKDLHPSVLFDLQKYYPESFQIFHDHKNKFIKSCVVANLERGIEEGLYRPNLNVKIIAGLYLTRIGIIWDEELFPSGEFKHSEIHLEIIRYHIRGIASPEGLEYLSKRISQEFPNLL